MSKLISCFKKRDKRISNYKRDNKNDYNTEFLKLKVITGDPKATTRVIPKKSVETNRTPETDLEEMFPNVVAEITLWW